MISWYNGIINKKGSDHMNDMYSFLDRWSEYDLVDSREEFKRLLNILEANDLDIDDIFNTDLNIYTQFGDILGEFKSYRDVADSLLDFNVFYETKEELMDFIECMAETRDETAEEIFNNAMSGSERGIEACTETRNGYVWTVWC